jgi:hypothetical protein
VAGGRRKGFQASDPSLGQLMDEYTRRDKYDTIGRGYRSTRRSDPRIAHAIHAALGDARLVLNVGAGAGAYEPHASRVVAVGHRA